MLESCSQIEFQVQDDCYQQQYHPMILPIIQGAIQVNTQAQSSSSLGTDLHHKSDEHTVAAIRIATPSSTNLGQKRDRLDTIDGETDQAEKHRQKLARLDGHPTASYHPMNSNNTVQPSRSAEHTTETSASAPTTIASHDPVQQVHVPNLPHSQSSAIASPKTEGQSSNEVALRSFPYFYYRDFSKVPDPDPLTPLTAPGRVPNFPAKMHSILSRADLVDVVAWMPHGRAWRVLKPREFEIRVIPTYFEHAKFSSFIRQANGWGFRRITQGKDRNAYYHEMFLRGLPHLCKMMKRPGVSEKQAADPDQEPDFYKVAEENPVPEKAEDESILLQCTLQGGPKARMPICFGAMTSTMASQSMAPGVPPPSVAAMNPHAHNIVPSEYCNATSAPANVHFSHQYQPTQSQQNGTRSVHDANTHTILSYSYQNGTSNVVNQGQSGSFLPNPAPLAVGMNMNGNEFSTSNSSAGQQGQGNNTQSHDPTKAGTSTPPLPAPNVAAALQCSDAASQFAAGFAAAAALSQQQFRAFLGQALATLPNMQQGAGSNNNGAAAPGPAPTLQYTQQGSQHHQHTSAISGAPSTTLHYSQAQMPAVQHYPPAPAPGHPHHTQQQEQHQTPQQQQYQPQQYLVQPTTIAQHHITPGSLVTSPIPAHYGLVVDPNAHSL